VNAAAEEVHRLLRPLPTRFREHLGTVCESHHEEDLTDPLRFPLYEVIGQDIGRESVNVQYAAVLLRTADLLHVTHDRTPSVMFKAIKFTDPKGVAEWERQRGTFSVAPKARIPRPEDPDTTDIIIKADFAEEQPLFALQEYIVYANEQVQRSKRWVDKSQEGDGAGYSFPWRGVKGDVRLEGVAPCPLKFELDRGRLLDLLVGHTLYDNPTVAVRELLQNAIDAVRYQHHLEKREAAAANRSPPPIGSVRVSWNSATRKLAVEDDGVGMDLDVIQHHLMRVGSSFYNTPKFEAENRDFTPISRFGIGILTCFMISDDIEIVTFRGRKGYRIRMTSVHADYLLRELSPGDPKLEGLQPHGTRVTLLVRESVDLAKQSVADILRYWVIVPECQVEYREAGRDPERIGFDSVTQALAFYHRPDSERAEGRREEITAEVRTRESQWRLEYVTKRKEFPAAGDGPHGTYEMAFVVEAGWFPERLFVDRPHSAMPAVCVEGIRVSERIPGFEVERGDKWISSILSVRGNRALRTTVSRSDLESDEETREVAQLCLGLLMEYVRDEVARLSDLPGHPLSQASTASVLLTRAISSPLTRPLYQPFRSLLLDLPALVVERLEKVEPVPVARRELWSRRQVSTLSAFWTVESRLLDSLGIISRDLGRELSLNEFLTALSLGSEQLRYSPLLPDVYPFKSDLLYSHQPVYAHVSRRHKQTAVRWEPAPAGDPGRTDADLYSLVKDDSWQDFVRAIRRLNFDNSPDFDIWVAAIEGDTEPIIRVRTSFGVLLRRQSEQAGWWGLISSALRYYAEKDQFERLAEVVRAAEAFRVIVGFNLNSDSPYTSVRERDAPMHWRLGRPALRRALELLGLRDDLPDELEPVPRHLAFDARDYWRNWFDERKR
jgi:hypothetical protein